tara:strand:- start:432 stop:1079 length:648 start_codon:yes stop_codon:yes gene_type:complete
VRDAQVEYASEAARKGNLAVGVTGTDSVVVAAEKQQVAKLQSPQTFGKVYKIDDNVCVTFAGLTADARILINRAREEAQSHKLTLEDGTTVEYIARFIGNMQQKYTQRSGVRPFGLSTLVAGLSEEGNPTVYHTDPSGTVSEWKSYAIGRNSKAVREWMDKNHEDTTGLATVKLALRAMSQNCDLSSERIEVAVVDRIGTRIISVDKIQTLINDK